MIAPIVAVIAIVSVVVLSNRQVKMPNGLSIIVTDGDYNDSLNQVKKLSHDGVANFNTGQEITPKQKEDLLKAAQMMDNMNLFKPDTAPGFFEAGLLYYLAGDSDTALNRIQQCFNNVRVAGTFKSAADQANMEGVIGDAHHIRALIAFDHHDYKTALDEVNESLQHVKNRPNIYVAKARVEVQLNKIHEAKDDLNQALLLDPNNLQAAQVLGLLQH